jgi:hypothetical protein
MKAQRDRQLEALGNADREIEAINKRLRERQEVLAQKEALERDTSDDDPMVISEVKNAEVRRKAEEKEAAKQATIRKANADRDAAQHRREMRKTEAQRERERASRRQKEKDQGPQYGPEKPAVPPDEDPSVKPPDKDLKPPPFGDDAEGVDAAAEKQRQASADLKSSLAQLASLPDNLGSVINSFPEKGSAAGSNFNQVADGGAIGSAAGQAFINMVSGLKIGVDAPTSIPVSYAGGGKPNTAPNTPVGV